MSKPKDKPTVEECLRFVEDYLAEIKLNTEKFGIDYGRDIAILQAIRKLIEKPMVVSREKAMSVMVQIINIVGEEGPNWELIFEVLTELGIIVEPEEDKS